MEKTDAYAEGYKAFCMGEPETDNPYDAVGQEDMYISWNDAWNDAWFDPANSADEVDQES